MSEEKKLGRTPRKDKNIHQRLNAIMAEVNYIKKDKKIEVGRGSYSVTGHDAVTKLIHPLLVKHGINLIPSVASLQTEALKDKYGKDITLARVEMTFRWVNIDDPEDFFVNTCHGFGLGNDDKTVGKGISYAQRYIVLKTLHLETGEKDIEEDNTDFVPKNKQQKMESKPNGNHPDWDKKLDEPITAELKNDLINMGYGLKWQAPETMKYVSEMFVGKKISELNCNQAMECLTAMADLKLTAVNPDDVPL